MARFKIYSKDGKERYEGKPRYSGSYLKPSYLEFSEIASPEPISWEVGDYVDYPRTGMRYYLYSIPQPSKNARKGSHGRAFTYSNVQFHAATKELEIALFRDLVVNDNNIHFSTSPDVATTENVQGIADRIQVCMNDLYPGRWEIRVASLDATSEVDLTEPKDFALSGGTCLDALSKIYELWQDIGWIHTHENGKEVITIGYANRRIAENTSEPYLYGKGNGLTAIKKNQTNKDEFATRLYVYGSERNLPARYYNGKDILNAESVDIRNLMLPLDKWGTTDGLPDARKAYLENAEAVARYGVIPKTHYFDSTEAGANIYPSITGMTVGQIRKVLSDMGQTEYSPDAVIYPDDAERVDEVLSAVNPTDDGVERKDGKRYEDSKTVDISSLGQTITIPGGAVPDIRIGKTFNVQFDKTGMGVVSMDSGMNFVLVGDGISSVKATYELSDASSASRKTVLQTKEVEGTQVEANASNWTIPIPAMRIAFEKMEYSSFPVYLSIDIYITPTSVQTERTANLVAPSYPVTFNFSRSLQSTFVINLKQIGFDINERAPQGAGKKISMKSGKCEGREFVISNCRYDEDTDSWSLTCKRQRDDTLGLLFPYNQYEIASGDRFVLLDIALPDSYIGVAMERLFAEGEKLLARASRIQNNYEPSIDAKVMIESGRTLREGMYMEITDEDVVDNTTDYILIDSLSIYEDESAIPTYKATLRERRKVTYKGTPSATSETKTSSVDSGEVDASDVDLSGYATKTYVDDTLKPFADMFYFHDENTIGTKYNFFSEGQNAAGGIGEEEGESGGSTATIVVDTAMSDTSDNAVANKVIKAYVDNTINDIKANPQTYIQLKTINGMEIYGEGNIAIEGGSSEGTSGLAAINVNSQSFQPDLDGIVTLPNYRPLNYYNQDLAEKVDKVDGKGLSTNDYTTADKNKLAGIAAGAEVNVQSDWNATSGDAFIKNKPTLSVVATSGSYNDLSDKPTIPVEVTETTVAGWGFTKNTGTYIKPTTGIPKSHLANAVQISLGLADTALQPSALNDYPTTTEVRNALMEVLEKYALARDLTAVDERLADVEAFFDSKEDADSLVNKWHEIVNFLDATEGDTLDSILGTYAKGTDLENAVKRIAANETAIGTHTSQISTLQGYFTNGKAKNADKLDGYDSSYFATAANLNNLVTRVTIAEGKIDGLQEDNETFMSWYNAVGKYFKYDSVNEAWYLDGDFYATGQNAAGGVGEEDGGGSGIILDYDSIVDALGYVPLQSSDLTLYLTKTAASTTYATINTVTALTNRVSTLEGKATAVSFSQTLTSGKEIGRLTIDGSTKTLYAPSTYTFSELDDKPSTLNGYGITDAIYWVNNMDDPDTTYYRHAGYGYPAGGWNGAGPAIAFGANTSYYAQIQAGNDTNTPYMFFRPTSNGVHGETWFRFLFDVGNSNIDSERFSCRGDLVLNRNTADGSTFVNYGPYTNDSAALNLYGRVIELYTTDGVLIGGSKALTESSGDGRYFPLTGNRAITGSVTIESGLTVTGSASITGGLSKIPQIYGPPVTSTEGNYFKWTLFYQTGNDTMYIQAGKNSGTSTDPYKGNIAFSGYGGRNAARVDFSADATYFNGSMSCGALTAKSTTINGTLAVTGATSLNSTLSVTGTATLGGGAFLPPSKTIRFQDAATETFTISFDSGVGGLNLSGATRTLGLASFQKGIQIEHGQSIAFVDKDGVKQYITLDEENGAIKVIGNLFATGQNAAGGAGGEELGMLTSWENPPTNLEGMTLSASLGIDLYNNSKKVLTSWDNIPEEGDEGYEDFVLSEYTVSADLVKNMNTDITTLKNRTIPSSAVIKLTNLCGAYTSGTSGITYSSMDDFITWTVFNSLRDGIAIKVSDTSSSKKRVWDYSVDYTASGYKFLFTLEDKYVEITSSSTTSFTSSTYTITHNL